MGVGIEAFVAITVRALERASRQNSGRVLQVRLHFFINSFSVGIDLIRIRQSNKEQVAPLITGCIVAAQ